MKKASDSPLLKKILSGPDKPKRKFHTTPGYKFNPETGGIDPITEPAAEEPIPSNPADFELTPEPAAPSVKLESWIKFIYDWRGSASVRSMTLEQKGLFGELLDYCYELASLPTNEGELQRMTGATDKEWKASWLAVKRMFYEQGGRLRNEKVDAKRPVFLARQQQRRHQAQIMREAKHGR